MTHREPVQPSKGQLKIKLDELLTPLTTPDAATPSSKSLSGFEDLASPTETCSSGNLVDTTGHGKEKRTWEISYDLSPEIQGRGMGTIMVDTVMNSWVRLLGIERVVGVVQIDNPASAAVLRKNGFKRIQSSIVQWPLEKGGDFREVEEWEWLVDRSQGHS
ncbi:hypothetical protein TREMEDRAFT_59212 [Tremella mesenterica DSM 1558]|uniref:uncharacterized protein n=1 Tax=Tremella mesenterica (strain ATCC 24925 / CBS 8224 / DSM 1558 / NBRC 9311 / NRRL Y-6157 / RJB 2259-6 / UBC 559-6) TaxID=578456 RepID=UPI0003F49F3F|nr:uncharacterized protein TREMEDRAFT_59212 [Tremella mesenterica DSM 1558]EIW73049.1 hypothetical protein TREMEDRAFT_59212 [Tremella mesenterica DSM 1558]